LELQHSSLIKTVATKLKTASAVIQSMNCYGLIQSLTSISYHQHRIFLRYVLDKSRWNQVSVRHVSCAYSIFRNIRYFSVRVSSSHGYQQKENEGDGGQGKHGGEHSWRIWYMLVSPGRNVLLQLQTSHAWETTCCFTMCQVTPEVH